MRKRESEKEIRAIKRKIKKRKDRVRYKDKVERIHR